MKNRLTKLKTLVIAGVTMGLALQAHLLSGSALAAEEFVLARSGEKPATVVIPAQPSEAVAYAAEELVSYVQQMTGVTMPIVSEGETFTGRAVLLGLGKPSASLGPDGWRLVVHGDRLSVSGSAERGVLYGVYELLERFGGIGWYAWWHTVVPKRTAFVVPGDLNLSEKPAVAIRDQNWYGPFSDPAYAARLRLNSRTYAKEQSVAKYGGAPHRFGAGLKSAHTHQILLPAKDYFKTHPEYFAEVKGARVTTFGQLCLTNPDVLRIVTSNVLAAIRRDPTAKYFGVSQNDFECYCTCKNCKAVNDEEGSPAGTNIRFVNAVAEAVEREYPDKIIETLAYLYTRNPPKTRARKNVLVCLCSIACDFGHPIAEPNDYVHNPRFVTDMCGWQKKCDQIYIWDYVVAFGNYLSIFANESVLQPNIKFFHDHGAVAIFEQGDASGLADLSDLKCWLAAKFMWNPDASYDALVRQFTDGHYGKAAPFLREYLARRKPLAEFGKWRPWEDVTSARVSTEFLDSASQLFACAKDVVKDDPLCFRAVREAEMSIDYMRLIRAGLYDRITPHRELARRFLADCEKYAPVVLAERNGDKELLPIIEMIASENGLNP